MDVVSLLIQGELEWGKVGADVRFVAEGLTLRHAAAAPIVVLSAEDDVRHLIRADLWLGREWLLAHVTLETPLKIVTLVLLD